MMVRRTIGAALLVLIALLVTLKFKAVLGWSPDLILPVLVVVAFFLDAYSLALLTLLAVWVLDWQMGLPPELWVMIAAPAAAMLGKEFLPSKPWATLAIVVVVSEVLMYILATGDAFFANAGFIVSNVLFAVFLALSLQRLTESVYGKN